MFQGTEGAYSHAAMCRFFGEDVNGFHVRKFRDAMEAIADGAADFAVLPIENSTAGIVADNFDLLVDFENYIVGQQVIKCEHVLMGLPGTTLEDLSRFFAELGCRQAFNLDGGESTHIWFQGKEIGWPARKNELSDLIYIEDTRP